MRKRALLRAGFLLFLSLVLPPRTPDAFAGETPRQDQPKTLRFYALTVVCEKDVQQSKDALGAPDGRSAEILPGGQLVLFMENVLLPSLMVGNGETGGCLDSGSVIGKGEAEFSLEGRYTWHNAEDEQRHEWIPLGFTLTGFCIAPLPQAIGSISDGAGVDMIRITNRGTESLFVDAVIGFDRDS